MTGKHITTLHMYSTCCKW